MSLSAWRMLTGAALASTVVLFLASAVPEAASAPLEGPLTPVLDDFNRGNEAPLSQDGNWALADVGGSGINRFGVLGGRMANVNLGPQTYQNIVYRSQTYSDDLEVHGTVIAGGGGKASLVFNIKEEGSPTYDGYVFTWIDRQNSIAGDEFRFWKVSNGSFLGPIAQADATTGSGVDLHSGDKLLARRIGTRMEGWAYHFGTWDLVLVAYDASYTGGKIGAYITGQEQIDDFGGGALETPPAVPPLPGLSPTPDPPVLDNFNRRNENPVSQSGNWAPTGVTGGVATQLRGDKLTSFAQPSTSYRSAPFTGNMEAAATVTSVPSTQGDWLAIYIALRDAGTPGWDGYELRVTRLSSGAGWWQVSKITDGLGGGIGAGLTAWASPGLMAVGESMLLRRRGERLEFWWRPAGGAWALKRTVRDVTYTTGGIGVGGWRSGALDDFSGGGQTVTALLQQYAPAISLDTQEAYWPDSAATITDNYQPGYTNELKVFQADTFPDFPVLAASDPDHEKDHLSLGYLRPTYQKEDATTLAATPVDYVDEASATRDADAQRMHANPLYANRTYARAFPVPGGTLLQYWFFYYNNPKTFVWRGDHEGDWEMIQIRLDAADAPVAATYAQHVSHEYCSWPSVLTWQGRPVVYVAHESHASYFRPGFHTIPVEGFPDGSDVTDGGKELFVPTVEVIDAQDGPLWMQWPGKWGGAETSPQAPPHQEKWKDPLQLEQNARPCTAPAVRLRGRLREGLRGQSVPARPAAPKIAARRAGNNVVITYQLTTRRGSAPWLLVTTVDGPNDRYTPTSKRTVVTGKTSGRIVQPIYLSRGRLVVLASVRARNGARSDITTARVR